MFLACSKHPNLLCRLISKRTTQMLLLPGGKSARLKYRLAPGSHGYKDLTDFTRASLFQQ
jgi:hypothetical protein